MKKIAIISFLLSLMLAIVPVYVGFQHNPMGEFCANDVIEPCNLDYFYALSLWFFWFVAIFGGVFCGGALFMGCKALTSKITRT